MSADFKVTDLQWDMTIVNGALVTTARGDEVRQRLRTRLQRERGEWFLNTTVGLPWYSSILGSKQAQRSELIIRQEVMRTGGVTGITAFNPLWANATRQLSIYIQVTTAYGRTSAVRLSIGA